MRRSAKSQITGVLLLAPPVPHRALSCLRAELPFRGGQDATIKEKARAAVRISAARIPAAWYIAGMKKPLTVTEFARMGGKARAETLSPERRREIASQAGKKGGRPRKATLRESPLTTGRSLTPRVSKKST